MRKVAVYSSIIVVALVIIAVLVSTGAANAEHGDNSPYSYYWFNSDNGRITVSYNAFDVKEKTYLTTSEAEIAGKNLHLGNLIVRIKEADINYFGFDAKGTLWYIDESDDLFAIRNNRSEKILSNVKILVRDDDDILISVDTSSGEKKLSDLLVR